MTLKDRLTEALAATPAENAHRRDILNAALNAGDSDAEIGAALNRLIEAREQKAAQLEKNGQTPQAKAERDEAIALRLLAEPGQTATAAAATGKAKVKKGPVFTKLQMALGGVAVVVLGVALWQALKPAEEVDVTQPQAGQQVTVFKDDHTLGNPNAPIKVVEYAAPVCPVCAHFNSTEFPQFKKEFIDTGRVFYIFRVYPIRPQDGAIEGIARCLPKERYFAYIDMMFREQPQWDPDGNDIPNPEAAIISLAAREGLSADKAKACMTDPTALDRINQTAQDAQIRYQIDGTPTFVMNGQVVNFPPSSQSRLEVLRLRINSLSGGAAQ
jgi:protein-disulfide isomerase